MESVVLTEKHINNLKIAKVFKEWDNENIPTQQSLSATPFSPVNTVKSVTGVEFDRSGTSCVCTINDESLYIYDVLLGKYKGVVHSKKYGLGTIRFTHRPTTLLHTSTKQEGTLKRTTCTYYIHMCFLCLFIRRHSILVHT